MLGIPPLIQYIAIFLGIFAFLASVVKFILGWGRKEFLEFFKLMFSKRCESLFQSKEFPPTHYISEKIYLQDKPYGIESINLTSGIEIKEYYTSEPFEINPFAINLLFVGWGLLKGEKRYLGSLMDQGDIGQVFFLDKDENEISHIPISLPATEHERCLKLADMRPSVSGDPPDDLVKAVGLITIAKVDYIPWKDTSGEGFCNIWVSSIKVPKRTRHIKFKTHKGSMHITNIIVIRSLWRSEGKTKVRILEKLRKYIKKYIKNETERKVNQNTEELTLEDIFNKYESKANELVKEAEKLKGEKASKIFEEAAYLYKDEKKRKEILKRAGESLINKIKEEEYPKIPEIGLQESKNLAVYKDAARVLFLAATYFYQAECLDGKHYEEISQYIEYLGDRFATHDPPYLKEAFEYWFRMGWISLMYADQVKTRKEVINAVNKAYDFYIRKIVETILHFRQPSRSDIDYAIEMCKKMQRCYGEKQIDAPEVMELNEKLCALEERKKQFESKSKIK